MSLDDKRILVIGGGSGIGFAVAEAAVKAGAQVVVASTNAERVKTAAVRLGNRASSAQLDIATSGEVTLACEKTDRALNDRIVESVREGVAVPLPARVP